MATASTSKTVTLNVVHEAKSWDDGLDSDYEPALLPCAAEARTGATEEDQESSGEITHAGGVDDKDGVNSEPEGAEKVPA